MIWTAPNILTIARIALAPVIALLPFIDGLQIRGPLERVTELVHPCPTCGNLGESDPCAIVLAGRPRNSIGAS